MRSVYDRFGPRIARKIRSHWLADVSYLLFAPVAIAAWVILILVGRAKEIDRAYRG